MEDINEIKKIQDCKVCMEIVFIKVGEETWFKGKSITTVLEYTDTNQTIRKHVEQENKQTFGQLIVRLGKQIVLSWNEKQTIYINENGLKRLLLKCEKPIATIIAREYGIDVQTKYLRKELEIIGFMQEYLTVLRIPFQFQKRVHSYRVDLYLPEQAIAIEIDENGHSDRNIEYEAKREKCICKALKCEFLRFNPDEEGFKMSHCIAELTKMMFNHKSVSV